MIAAGQIRLIQFEYNYGAIVSRFLLRDFHRFFNQYDDQVGKLYPTGVLFRDYAFEQEDFHGPNYVACRREDRQLIETISVE